MLVDMTFDEKAIGHLLHICATSTNHMAPIFAKQFKGAMTRQLKRDAEALALAAAIKAAKDERAANATLTLLQAQCLAALRVGKGNNNEWHEHRLAWGYSRSSSMGGARGRMFRKMQDDGLLDDRWNATAAGLERLTRWEATHNHPWPIPEGE